MEERRVVNVDSEARFFSKVYGLMAVGVGISALIAVLMVTVFKAQTYTTYQVVARGWFGA